MIEGAAGNKMPGIFALSHPFDILHSSFPDDHFAWLGAEIAGVSATGRATTRLLQMNARHQLLLRSQLPAGWNR